jgi:hypothetical protein
VVADHGGGDGDVAELVLAAAAVTSPVLAVLLPSSRRSPIRQAGARCATRGERLAVTVAAGSWSPTAMAVAMTSPSCVRWLLTSPRMWAAEFAPSPMRQAGLEVPRRAAGVVAVVADARSW